MSDTHGCYESIVDSLNIVDLDSDKENKLIVLGDYVDGGKGSYWAIYHIKKLEETYPNQVEVLLGNHDKMFIDWYKTLEDDSQWLLHDVKLLTIKRFVSEEEFELMEAEPEMRHGSYFEITQFLVKKIMENHAVLLNWLSEKDEQLPYYETENQIYVYAGICEEDKELWKHATEPNEFLWKYPAETGFFSKILLLGMYRLQRLQMMTII